MEHIAVGHIRDIGRDALLAQDAIADAIRTCEEIEEIEDLDSAHAVLKIVTDVRVASGTLLLALERKIELAS